MNTDEFKFLVEHAIKAPSGHNTQPWKFENTQDGIILHPDFKRTLPVVDVDNYELYISLGCALENLLIAAKQKSYKFKVHYPEKQGSSIFVDITKNETGDITPDLLFNEISKRQVTKTKYNDKALADVVLNQLDSCFNFEGVSLGVLA